MPEILPNAAELYFKTIDPGYAQPQWVPTRAERLYYEALRELQGLAFPLAIMHEQAVVDEVCLIVGRVTGCFHGNPESQVISIPTKFLLMHPTGENTVIPPIEDRAFSGPEAWWKEKGLDVVRVLTSFADGFQAFTPATPRVFGVDHGAPGGDATVVIPPGIEIVNIHVDPAKGGIEKQP